MASEAGGARLLDLAPELADGLAPELRERLRQHVWVTTVELPAGNIDVSQLVSAAHGARTLLVVRGVLVCETMIADVAATALYGPGDLMRIGDVRDTLMPPGLTWTVPAHTVVVPLDRPLVSQFPTWPGLGARLLVRAAEQARREVALRAIAQLPRVEMRVLGLLWHLAERWGQVGGDGLLVPLSLTHEMIGRLVGAARPTVSLALKELAELERVTRRPNGTWVLSQEGLDTFTSLIAPAPVALSPPKVLEPGEHREPVAPAHLGRFWHDDDAAVADLV
jgi:hypothetical protein